MGYTKGEWIADNGDSELWGVFEKGNGAEIAYLGGLIGNTFITTTRSSGEHRANAHLISAAPDTAEALQELISFLIHDGLDTNNRLVPIIDKGTKALKKAGVEI